MTTMQPWEKASHWSKTYFSLTTLTYFLLISRKIWLKCCGKLSNLVCFLIMDSGGNSWCPSRTALTFITLPKTIHLRLGTAFKISVHLYNHSWLYRLCMNCNLEMTMFKYSFPANRFKCSIKKTCRFFHEGNSIMPSCEWIFSTSDQQKRNPKKVLEPLLEFYSIYKKYLHVLILFYSFKNIIFRSIGERAYIFDISIIN